MNVSSFQREREIRLNEWTDWHDRDIPGFFWSLKVDEICSLCLWPDLIWWMSIAHFVWTQHNWSNQTFKENSFRYKMLSWPNSFHRRVACSLGKSLRKKEGQVSRQGGGRGAGPEREGGHWFGEGKERGDGQAGAGREIDKEWGN